MLVLDTNILIELATHNSKIVKFLQNLLEKFPSKPYITAPNYSEFLYGYMKKDFKKQEIAISFLEQYNLLNTSKESSKLFAKIKYHLEKSGQTIPLFDILIASIVVDKRGVLVTLDEHFKNIDGFKVIIPN